MPLITPQGRSAIVTGDPGMSDKTRKALGTMIDAAAEYVSNLPHETVQENERRSYATPSN